MDKDPVKRQQMIDFMAKILSAYHAERAPSSIKGAEVWYLPLFGVHHPKKPDQIQGVFDSSATYKGTYLKSVLMKGPDIANRLIGVLLRFRKEAIAVMGDIEKMFHCFHVPERHRDYFRFLWHDDNDPDKELIEYHMRVHVFGNKPSPAIATYGLRKAAASSSLYFGQDVKEFVDTNFYVDDGIASLPSTGEAIDFVKRTQAALRKHGNICFHKIASNSPEVMSAFPSDDRASDLKDLNFMDHSEQCVPIQRSLGISWDIKTDTFVLQVSVGDKPYTKHGILSSVHSIYDPMGFLAPVTINSRLILRDAVSSNVGWDDILSHELQQEWSEWLQSLRRLKDLHVSRPFTSLSFKGAVGRQILMYCDASERAIAAVCYLELETLEGESQVGFLMGKTKVAPKHGHTIPRLELCAAVLSVQLADLVCESLDI
ncbi:uncharacterized protein LOC124286500 [Haliotis rubra]|uniref:uncharacterized protein LOC124286500 n=1 Tax=Haliotis rubra TaxID=36100 RepID=UPI001EE5DD6F|nr:uncharacterized protein LOC124286500 [Haliotis rubra]